MTRALQLVIELSTGTACTPPCNLLLLSIKWFGYDHKSARLTVLLHQIHISQYGRDRKGEVQGRNNTYQKFLPCVHFFPVKYSINFDVLQTIKAFLAHSYTLTKTAKHLEMRIDLCHSEYLRILGTSISWANEWWIFVEIVPIYKRQMILYRMLTFVTSFKYELSVPLDFVLIVLTASQ